MPVPRRTRTSRIALAVGLLAGSACGSDSSSPPPVEFTIAAGSTSFSIPRGGSTTTFVKATRVGAFAGPISFGITGGANMATGLGNTSVADSARVDLAVSATAPAGTSTVGITGSSPGSRTQKLTITVTITAPAGSVGR